MNGSTNGADERYEVATLGGGCFWCLEAVYDELKGVVSVESGYAGGHVINPSYSQVCEGRTGHAEVVRVTFDPQLISFEEILRVFFTIHDPTTLNRQGNDVGPQYRSAIFYHSPQQKATAETVIAQLMRRSSGRSRLSPRSRRSAIIRRRKPTTRSILPTTHTSPTARWWLLRRWLSSASNIWLS